MKANLKREDFHLGTYDAWSEEERQNLDLNFLPIKQFSEIADPDKVFLCGRRGTGKSAIAQMLAKNGEQDYKDAIPGEDTTYGKYIRIVERMKQYNTMGKHIDISFSIRRLWLWVIQVKAMQIILDYAKKDKLSMTDDLQRIEAYFKTLPKPLNDQSQIGELLWRIFDKAIRILKKSNEEDYDEYIEDLVSQHEFHLAINAMRNHMTGKKMLIILDTLESYKIFQEYMIEAFQGVLDAIIALWTDSRMDHIYLKLFLPAEVFDSVFGKYPGKVSSRSVFLRWRSADLISMIGRRFLNVLIRTEAVEKSYRKI